MFCRIVRDTYLLGKNYHKSEDNNNNIRFIQYYIIDYSGEFLAQNI